MNVRNTSAERPRRRLRSLTSAENVRRLLRSKGSLRTLFDAENLREMCATVTAGARGLRTPATPVDSPADAVEEEGGRTPLLPRAGPVRGEA